VTHRERTRKIVLVIDDDPGVARTLSMVLEQQGYTSAFAFSAHNGIEVALQLQPHVAIVDIQLGDDSGIDTAIELQRLAPGCRILLMTGNPESEAKLEHAEAQGIHFEVLAKPVPPNELLDKLKALLR
jgi:DNA-binding response OmpR family regulator